MIAKVILKNKWKNARKTLQNRVWHEIGINYFLERKKTTQKSVWHRVRDNIGFRKTE